MMDSLGIDERHKHAAHRPFGAVSEIFSGKEIYQQHFISKSRNTVCYCAIHGRSTTGCNERSSRHCLQYGMLKELSPLESCDKLW